MNIQPLINAIRYKLRYGITVEWYNFWYMALRCHQKITPQVASIDETIRIIIEDQCSVSRFGHGEMLLTNPDKEIAVQNGNLLLAHRLKEIARRFWRTHFFLYGSWWDRLLLPDRLYYNTFITRPYMDFASKEDCPRWFHQMKAIWKDRDVVFIEGEKSRLGVGNDLFDNVKSIRRILCPPRDAFDRYEEILNEAQKLEKTALFLIALGPTATVLAYDLFKSGYQAIDAGHVDVEYEWWRMGAKRKVKLERKYVNEAANGKQVSDAGEFYRKQIIAKIY